MRFALRAATEDIHRELDHSLSALNLEDSFDYRRFLQFHGRTVPALEHALSQAGIEDLIEGWSKGRRSSLIAADLDALGEEMPQPAAVSAVAGTGAILGTAYVVEGSRLGGRMLAKKVPQNFPASFLHGDGSLGSWPALIDAIERHLNSEPLMCQATEAARSSFLWFLNIAHEAGIQ